VKSIFAQQINHSIYLSIHTTAGEGTCILVTDLGLILLASWHSNTPSLHMTLEIQVLATVSHYKKIMLAYSKYMRHYLWKESLNSDGQQFYQNQQNKQ
jgi:hypothetical protein